MWLRDRAARVDSFSVAGRIAPSSWMRSNGFMKSCAEALEAIHTARDDKNVSSFSHATMNYVLHQDPFFPLLVCDPAV